MKIDTIFVRMRSGDHLGEHYKESGSKMGTRGGAIEVE